jgi:hypothetical protein
VEDIEMKHSKTGVISLIGSPSCVDFIDCKSRDPTHFRYILNYLRDNGQIFLPNKKQFLSELLKECQFFNIEGLCEKIEGKLGKISDGSVEEDETKEDKGEITANSKN